VGALLRLSADYSPDTISFFILLSLRKTKNVNMEKTVKETNLSHCGSYIDQQPMANTSSKAITVSSLSLMTDNANLTI